MKTPLLLIPLFIHALGIAQTHNYCNRKTFDKSIAKLLPKGICIPDDYTIEQVVKDFDFNGDGKNDVVIRYCKYPLKDGNMRYYSVYEQTNDAVYQVKKS